MHFLKSIFVIMIGLFMIVSGHAQKKPKTTGQSSTDLCQQVPCRPDKRIKLKLNPKGYVQFDFPKSPYVAWGDINVLAGEEVNVEFDESAKGLTNAHYVEKITFAERTITFKLTQTDNGMVLSVNNPFSKTITYECQIQHYKSEDLKDTDVKPVESRLVGLETWPYPIPQVLISNVRFE